MASERVTLVDGSGNEFVCSPRQAATTYAMYKAPKKRTTSKADKADEPKGN